MDRNITQNASARADEETPLLGKSSNGFRYGKRFKKHMKATLSRDWADLVLLACYVITGLLDSSAVFIWGAFVSMQTGNTIYLGLGLTKPEESHRWIKSIVSISSFCLGSLFFSFFHRQLVQRSRWVVVASFTMQLFLIVFAALIVTFGHDYDNDIHWQVLVPLASVAFQSSGQAVNSRVFQYGGLTSVVLTSNYCDLFSDPNLLAPMSQNVTRNRRIGAPVLLLMGAVFGGLWANSGGMEGSLWIAAVLKFAIVIAWMVWPGEKENEE